MTAEAEASLRQALALQEKWAADSPAVTRYALDLAAAQGNLGNLLRWNHKPEEALVWYGKAIATLQRVRQDAKVKDRAQEFLCDAHAGRARALVQATDASRSTHANAISSRPPLGIASRELRARFTSVCSIMPGSARTRTVSSGIFVSSVMCSPISRCSIAAAFRINVVRSRSRGSI